MKILCSQAFKGKYFVPRLLREDPLFPGFIGKILCSQAFKGRYFVPRLYSETEFQNKARVQSIFP